MSMELIRGIRNIKQKHCGSVLTIGNFDGVHLGHQKILSCLKKKSDQLQAPLAVMLFEPHPKEKLLSASFPARLCTLREKLVVLDRLGVDYVICQPFTRAFCQLSPQDFIQEVLLEKLKIKYLLVGDDFRYGYRREGNYQLLEQFSRQNGFLLSKTQTIIKGARRISSTLIREALKHDDFEKAKELLGRPYQISGRIIKGQQLGTSIGIPTANFQLKRYSMPVHGVYAARIHGLDKTYLAVANAGVKPTVKGCQPSLEAHLLDFSQNLYGQFLTLEFSYKIRDEHKFESLDALKRAILRDISTLKRDVL